MFLEMNKPGKGCILLTITIRLSIMNSMSLKDTAQYSYYYTKPSAVADFR